MPTTRKPVLIYLKNIIKRAMALYLIQGLALTSYPTRIHICNLKIWLVLKQIKDLKEVKLHQIE